MTTFPPERFDPFVTGFLDDPYPVYRWFRERDPVNRGVGPNERHPESWYFFRFEDVQTGLREKRLGREDPDVTGSDAPQLDEPEDFWSMARSWVVFRDPPAHTRLRGALQSAFAPSRVAAMQPRIEEIVHALLMDMEKAAGPVDLISGFAFPLPVMVVSSMLGVPIEDRALVRHWTDAMAPAIDILPPAEDTTMDRANAAALEFADYLNDIVNARRASPRNDLLSVLLSPAGGTASMSQPEVIANAIFLLLAGHETTVNLIGTGTYALLRNPKEWQAIVDSPDLITSGVEELLRYTSPVQITFRTALADHVIAGTDIERGEEIGLVIGAANRDPERFPDPERLDLHRDLTRHLAFGQGIHFCLGAALAKLEAQIAFRELAASAPHMAIASDPVWKQTIVLRGLDRLEVSLG